MPEWQVRNVRKLIDSSSDQVHCASNISNTFAFEFSYFNVYDDYDTAHSELFAD